MNGSAGFYLCSQEKQLISTGDNIFMCENGNYVLIMFLCDGIMDCETDNSDESLSFCRLFSNEKEQNANVCHL